MSVELIERDLLLANPTAAPPGQPASRDILGRIGNLETRIARTEREIDAAQAVRYRVFVEEMKAQVCVEDARRGGKSTAGIAFAIISWFSTARSTAMPKIRLSAPTACLRHEVAVAHGGFYSGSEFGVNALVARHPEKTFHGARPLLRSAAIPTKRTVELLWQGCWAYALHNRIDAMFGCGSFPGVQPEEHALALSFLHQNAVAKGEWAVDALPHLYREMDLMPSEAVNPRRALFAMPPLIKGYLRLGAMVGNGAVVDQAFNTTDVLIVLPISSISGRYVNYYGADAGRFASAS